MGENNPSKLPKSREAISKGLKGKPKTDEHKEIMRKNVLSKPKQTCEFCGKCVDSLNFFRWHGNNCKLKKLGLINTW